MTYMQSKYCIYLNINVYLQIFQWFEEVEARKNTKQKENKVNDEKEEEYESNHCSTSDGDISRSDKKIEKEKSERNTEKQLNTSSSNHHSTNHSDSNVVVTNNNSNINDNTSNSNNNDNNSNSSDIKDREIYTWEHVLAAINSIYDVTAANQQSSVTSKGYQLEEDDGVEIRVSCCII